jgi:hypothetical protein
VTQLPPPLPDAAPPLQQAQVQQQLIDARLAAKKIRRATTVAVTDGWMIAIFAGGSFICGLIGDVSGVLIGMAMAAIAWIEFTGAARLRRLDPTAPRRLAYNQLAFALLIIVYSLWSLRSSTMPAEIPPEYQDLFLMAKRILYFTLMAVGILAQGGTALYYITREKHLQKYVNETPPWIIEMQKAGSPL